VSSSLVTVNSETGVVSVPSGAIFPPRCVKTNVPLETRAYRSRILTWASPALIVAALLSGGLFILVYFLLRERCYLRFGVSPSIEAKLRRRWMLALLTTLGAIVALPFLAVYVYDAMAGIVATLGVAAIFYLGLRPGALRIVSRRGGTYQLKGFGVPFLKSLNAEEIQIAGRSDAARASSSAPGAAPDAPGCAVEPPYVVVPNKVALPPRCVQTNQPVTDRQYEAMDLPCYPSWLVIAMVVSPLFLVVAPFMRFRCRIKAGVSSAVRRKYRLRKAALLLGAIAPLAALVAAALAGNTIVAAVALVVFPLVTYSFIMAMAFFTSPLRARRQENGRFWIEGCSDEFLQSLLAEK
jgi:hypothetical protein